MTLSLHQKIFLSGVLILTLAICGLWPARSASAQSTQSGSIGIEGTVPGDPPTQGAVISFPTNGQTFSQTPITVRGICPDGLLIKLFKNNVFGGSVDCANGSFSIVTDLFDGQNDLVARVYDALDQAGPDSPTVTVTFDDPRTVPGPRVSLSSNYAKRGADPGQTLTWPIILSGGTGPYAISVDWGDGSEASLISQPFPGSFDLEHVYEAAGVYNIIIKATDVDGFTAYLQVVGVGNGPLGQTGDTADADAQTIVRTVIIWQPLVLFVILLFLAFWLGRRHSLYALRRQLEESSRR